MVDGVELDLPVIVEAGRERKPFGFVCPTPQSIKYGTASVLDFPGFKWSVFSVDGSGWNRGLWYSPANLPTTSGAPAIEPETLLG
jgi:hypothetical protein